MDDESNKDTLLEKIFIILGLTVFILGLILSFKVFFLDTYNCESTYGIITSLSDNSTTVMYEANNRIYKKKYSAYSSSYDIGEEIKIYYNKVNPNDSFISGMRYLVLTVPFIGFFFLILGIILYRVFKNSQSEFHRIISVEDEY